MNSSPALVTDPLAINPSRAGWIARGFELLTFALSLNLLFN